MVYLLGIACCYILKYLESDKRRRDIIFPDNLFYFFRIIAVREQAL